MITNIQLLRFLSAFGVAKMHVDMIQGAIFFPSGIVGVDVFFVISGFPMTTISWDRFGRHGEYKRFLHRGLLRIMPLYWIARAAFFALSLQQHWVFLTRWHRGSCIR
jgi:peptidoglycan/LPS O-acetylase OafA/YrhL